ncbi:MULTISPECIES: phage adaptor protein [unclassified Shinella]|uniref:phage adaptor protein n=1 Tax=unclassified Shinella TaxID=2643062 RepID=UPI00225CF426|nr:conserved hypothetical protein [Rhizobiaceae bacterium]CAK7259099.1 conserved protein of unknown function [Shinella sp. WSC3-e]
MARNTTLVKLLDLYRAECRLSFNPAHNAQDRDRQIIHLQRTQEWLWEDYDWPLLRVDRTIFLAAGQRYYDPPGDMAIDRISHIEVYRDQAYCPLRPGIDARHFTTFNSNLDERQWPPQRWRITEDERIEIWPIPDTDGDPDTLEGTLKITGIKNLQQMVADTDRATLDDRLIVLYAAAEFLASKGDKSASHKLELAKARYGKLRGAQQPRRVFNMFGCGQQSGVKRVPFGVYNERNVTIVQPPLPPSPGDEFILTFDDGDEVIGTGS